MNNAPDNLDSLSHTFSLDDIDSNDATADLINTLIIIDDRNVNSKNDNIDDKSERSKNSEESKSTSYSLIRSTFEDSRLRKKFEEENVLVITLNDIALLDNRHINITNLTLVEKPLENVGNKIRSIDDNVSYLKENTLASIEFLSRYSQNYQASQCDSNLVSSTFCLTPNHNLFYFVVNNDLDSIKLKVNVPDETTKDYYGRNLFQVACCVGHYDIVEYFISIGYDLNNVIENARRNETVLHFSVCYGYIDIVKLLIRNNISLTATGIYNFTALHYSSFYNNLEILKYFIDNNIYNNIYDIDNNGYNILHLSCWVGNYNIIKYLLSIEYDINTTNNDNQSALHMSVIKGHKKVVKLLLNHNIDINIKESKYGLSALHVASEFNQLDILKYFIDNNIYNNIYDIDNNGNNIFHLSCLVGNYNIIEYLLSIGYDINTTNNENRSALHISVSEGHKGVVELLLHHYIDINIKESLCCRSALHFASEFNQLDVLKYFIDNNIYNNIYDIDNNGCNIFHLSCMKGNYNIIEYLLSIEYDINTTNNDNRSALHISVMKGHKRVVELLLNHNIDINIKESEYGRSALHLASEFNQLDVLKYFIDNNIYNNIYDIDNNGDNIFHLSCMKGNYNIIEYLLSIEYDINTTNNDNRSALHISVMKGHKRVVELLLNHNIDINIKSSKYGRSALHYASLYNQLDILRYFIDNNINNNIYDIDKEGCNIFHLSCGKGNYNIIEYLLSIEYDINTTNNENHSALHISVSKGHKRIVELLLNHNIDVNIKLSKYGRSALHAASEFNQLDILKYFIDNNIYNNIYDIDNEGCNIFHLSCGKGNYNIIEYLLSIEYDINTTDSKNRSAFYYSVVFGNIALVELLINNKIDINIKDSNGQSPLDYALRYNRHDMYNYLIDNKIYKSIQDIDNDGNNL